MSMKKHLALVISSLNAGGAERVLSELANAWVEDGYKASLITLASPQAKPFYPLSKKINLVQLDQNTDEKAGFLVRLKNIIRRVLCLRKTLNQLHPDLIISFVDVMNITTLFATRGLKIPVVVAERTNPACHPLPSLYKRIRVWIYLWAFKIVVQTQTAATYFPSRLQTKMIIIPNFVKLAEKIKSTAQVKKPVHKIVSVGRLNPFKGFQDLIKAFSQLSAIYPTLELTIYGEGEERKNLESLVATLKLQERIHLPGTVENIYEVVGQADLFVFPSHYEGFPNALCEAMSVGLPVIASNCSGNIDVVQDGINGRLFPIGDVAVLVTLLGELIEDKDQRIQLSEEAIKISNQFGEIRVLKMWEHVITEATNHIQNKE
jgi:GalNAc-alpha-(1->4)-GalNAc-alpha-(1->3)-diNAcBac-PP-undecaprenol alpha-1,4-N-acetyl-D-galactosaminyltransferase